MKRGPMTTLCYIETEDSYLMLHRISRKEDVNKGKWIGIGGQGGDRPHPYFLSVSGSCHLYPGGVRNRIYVPVHGSWVYRRIGRV